MRAGTGPTLKTRGGAEIEWLVGDALAPEVEVWRITHPEGFSFGTERIKHLSGDVVLMVERGVLDVSVANDEFRLGPGDTLHFKGTQPHSWRNASDAPTTALLLGNVQAGARSGLVARMRRLRSIASTPAPGAPGGASTHTIG